MTTTTAPPTGKLGWSARRKLGKAQAALTSAELDRRAADVAAQTHRKQLDDEERTGAQRAEAAEKAAVEGRGKRLTQVAASVAAASFIVTAAMQIGFYTSLPWISWLKIVSVVLFVFVEGPAWYFALNSRDLALRGMSYRASARRVWVFSLGAAAMNAWHGHQLFPGRWDMAIICGAPSLIGPYVWHRHVHRLEMLSVGRSAAQVRAALARRMHHPILSWKAWALWAECGARLTKDECFLRVYHRKHGHLPHERPFVGRVERPAAAVPAGPVSAPAAEPKKRKRHRLEPADVKAQPAAGDAPEAAPVSAPSAAPASADEAVAAAAPSESVSAPASEPPSAGDETLPAAAERQAPALTEPSDQRVDTSDVSARITEFLAVGPALTDDAHPAGTGGETSRSNGSALHLVSDSSTAGVSADRPRPARESQRRAARKPQTKGGRGKGAKYTGTTREKLIAYMLDTGRTVDDLSGSAPAVAEEVSAGASTVRNALAALVREGWTPDAEEVSAAR